MGILIENAAGGREPFNEDKLRASLHRANADPEIIEKIVALVNRKLRPGLSTHRIYTYAYRLLQKLQRPAAGKYSLRRAIMELGPSGFPFERLVGEILKAEGYSNVDVGVTLNGNCVTHEVDVIAEKDNKRIMAECKFHNQIGIVSDVKTSLYVKARFEDLIRAGNKFDEAWVVTNTKLSDDAIKFARCAGMQVLGWNYPQGNSLGDRINKAKIHPITSLFSLTQFDKIELFKKNIVICKDLIEKPAILRSLGLKENKIVQVLAEADRLSN